MARPSPADVPPLSVVIPALNEQDIVADTIDEIERTLAIPHEVVVVDDHSRDRTPEILRACGAKYPNVRHVANRYPQGFPRALKCGWESAAAPVVVIVMADLSDEVATIPRMYEKIREGFDVVCGSRNMRGGGKTGGNLLQNFFSRLVGMTMRYVIGIPTHDVSNAFKMYRRDVLEGMRIESRAFDVSMEMTLRAFYGGRRITEVPTVWTGRRKGKSKLRILKVAPGYIRLYILAILARLGINKGLSG
ncbi:MAG: glycosyltransferase family 2 protein [bacterium]|nr:glycosyltransferase family 2 protein [bacterium]